MTVKSIVSPFTNSVTILAFSLLLSSCASSKKTEPKVVGYVGKNYYLSEAEKDMTADQLRSRIDSDAKVAAELRANESQKSLARGAMQIGLGMATGNYRINPVQDTPAARAKIKMKAYSDRLVEMGEQPVNPDAIMEQAITSRRKTGS